MVHANESTEPSNESRHPKFGLLRAGLTVGLCGRLPLDEKLGGTDRRDDRRRLTLGHVHQRLHDDAVARQAAGERARRARAHAERVVREWRQVGQSRAVNKRIFSGRGTNSTTSSAAVTSTVLAIIHRTTKRATFSITVLQISALISGFCNRRQM